MAHSTASSLTDQAATLAVSTRQWLSESTTKPFDIGIEDDVQAIEGRIERITDITKMSTSDRLKLDSAGTELWNGCRLQVMGSGSDDKEAMTMSSRVLAVAVALLDLASPLNAPGHIRILQVAFEAARVCMDTAQLDYALKVLKVAAKRLDTLEAHVPAIGQVQLDSISAEYYMLRAHLAWQQGRPDIADHLFTKVPLKAVINNRSAVVEGCLWIGRAALEASQCDASIKWLEIALEQLKKLDEQKLKTSNFDLHLRHTLARVYMVTNTPEATEKLEKQMTELKTKYGGTPAVQFLELDVIRRDVKPNKDKFFRVLRVIIEGPNYTEECLNLVLEYIGYSMRLSINLAFEMHQLLLRSLPCDKPEWTEKCFLQLPPTVTSTAEELEIYEERCIPAMSNAVASLSAEMEKGQNVSDENVPYLAYSVLKWVKWGLSRLDPAIMAHELESLCLDSYNLSLHIYNNFTPESAERALEITKEILDLSRQRYESSQTGHPQNISSNNQQRKTHIQMPSQIGYIAYQLLYLEVSIRASCVRSQLDSGTNLEHYTKINETIKSILDQASYYSEFHPLDDDSLRNLSANEFEAAVALGHWNTINKIVRKSERFFDATLSDHFMNCILSFEMPDVHRAMTLNTMIEIIRRAVAVTPILSDYIPAYVHYLFVFALAAAKDESSTQLPGVAQCWPGAYHNMAESVIDEVLEAVNNVSDLDKKHHKPDFDGDIPAGESSPPESGQIAYQIEELGYLATCSFNQAMDFYSAENDQACLRWAQKAILLAESMRTTEGENLVCLFQKRLEGLF